MPSLHFIIFISLMFIRRLITLSSLTLAEARSTNCAFLFQQRRVHLPSRHKLSDSNNGGQSVTGPVYEMAGGPAVKLFTKEGCTLCDKVKDVSFYFYYD